MAFITRCLAMLTLIMGLATPAQAQSASFSAPSGNIICYLETLDYDTGGTLPPARQPLICLVFQANWTLPDDYGDDDPTCDLDRTRTIIMPPRGPATARWTCHGDVFWPYPTPQIAYGSDWSVPSFGCSMRKDGVRCQNLSGHGIHLRRAQLVLN